jgi:hypothetical protein
MSIVYIYVHVVYTSLGNGNDDYHEIERETYAFNNSSSY